MYFVLRKSTEARPAYLADEAGNYVLDLNQAMLFQATTTLTEKGGRTTGGLVTQVKPDIPTGLSLQLWRIQVVDVRLV